MPFFINFVHEMYCIDIEYPKNMKMLRIDIFLMDYFDIKWLWLLYMSNYWKWDTEIRYAFLCLRSNCSLLSGLDWSDPRVGIDSHWIYQSVWQLYKLVSINQFMFQNVDIYFVQPQLNVYTKLLRSGVFIFNVK